LLVLLGATVLCAFLRLLSSGDTYVSMIFVLAVVVVARMTNGYLYGLLCSAISVVGVNYAFTKPYFVFNLSLSGYPLTFSCMLAVSIIVSTLTTRLKQQEKERYARKAEEMRANLLRAVSHDLRTPLTSIQGASTILTEQLDTMSPHRRTELLRQINEDAEWLIRMVENLLSVTRLNAGAARVHKRIEAAEEIVAEAVRKFRTRFSLPVEIRLPDELLLVPMDPILIEQVITNLLENAAYHAKGATHVVVRMAAESETAVFEIMDDGEGIHPDILPDIFSGMYHSALPSGDSSKNMGIGLTVCRTIIEAHGGVMTAENRPEGGALMRFTLPIKEDTHESEV
ncbi:MAG: DUF4118 domain-containing protein, partial [Clostridia bacterium]|nr:DUF4118 domain-containing protein [Clostridia bacterium]